MYTQVHKSSFYWIHTPFQNCFDISSWLYMETEAVVRVFQLYQCSSHRGHALHGRTLNPHKKVIRVWMRISCQIASRREKNIRGESRDITRIISPWYRRGSADWLNDALISCFREVNIICLLFLNLKPFLLWNETVICLFAEQSTTANVHATVLVLLHDGKCNN